MSTQTSSGKTYLLTMGWGLGDVLCTTAAIRALKEREPDARIIFRTHKKGTRPLEYDAPGKPPGSGGAPDEMLWYNPLIDQIIDMHEQPPAHDQAITFEYVRVGGHSLDVPLQARYFENLGLPWDPQTRFDADYWMADVEAADGRRTLHELNKWAYRYCAITPRCGWAGKMWHDAGWGEIIERLLAAGWTPVVLSGRHLPGAPWQDCINLSGQLDIRGTAGILNACQAMLCIEGGLSNLRFALGQPAVVLTCATRYGLQVWAPGELCTEYRNLEACDPCMWRGRHVEGYSNGPPGNTRQCPAGRSLRDVPAGDVWRVMEPHLQGVSGE